MKHLKNIIILSTLISSPLSLANNPGSDCDLIWTKFENYLSTNDLLSAANEIDHFRRHECLAKEDFEKRRMISHLRVEEYLEPIDEFVSYVSAPVVPDGLYKNTTTEYLINDYKRDAEDLKEILISSADDGLFDHLNESDIQNYVSKIDAILGTFNQAIETIKAEREMKYYNDTCASLISTQQAENSYISTERDTYKAEKEACVAEKETCEADKSACDSEKNNCELDKAICIAEKATCKEDALTCHAAYELCEAEKTQILTEKSTCESSLLSQILNRQNEQSGHKKSLSNLIINLDLKNLTKHLQTHLEEDEDIKAIAAQECKDLECKEASKTLPAPKCVENAKDKVRARLESNLEILEKLRLELKTALKEIGLHTEEEVNSI